MAGTDFSHLTNDELIKGIQALDLPEYIRSKAYGIDVRETLAQMTEMTIQLGVNMGLSPDDALAWARKLQNIDAQLAQKAEQAELEIERSRIDSFTTLVEGSTTGDAELIDARIGANGKTYENIGNAIRDQFNTVNNSLNFQDIEFTSGYNIKTGTTIGAIVDITPKASTGWSYAVIDCNEKSHFIISGYGTGDSPLWAFLDSDNKLLTYSDVTTERSTYVSAPSNASKIVINSLSSQLSNGNNEYVDGTATFKDVNALSDVISVGDFLTGVKDIEFTSGYNIETGTTIGSSVNITPKEATGWSYAIIECNEGTPFIISGYGTGNYPLWAFLDSDNKLLSYSINTKENNKYILAPTNTGKIVINTLTSNLSNGDNKYSFSASNRDKVLSEKVDKYVNFANGSDGDITFKNGYNVTTSQDIGTVIDITPKKVGTYVCAIVECEEGAQFNIRGTGGSDPRFWAFVSSTNTILSHASDGYSNQEEGVIITAPKGATKLIFNSLNYHKYSIEPVPYSKITQEYKTQIDELKNGQNVISPTADLIESCYINGVQFSNELQSPITDFAKQGDYFIHVPTHKILNDVVYMTYYANTRSGREYPSEMTARFVYAPLNDLTSKTYIDLQDAGETFDGKTVTAIYDTILMAKDSETLYLMWTAQLDGEYYRLYRTFTISTGVLSDVQYNTFSVNGNSSVFNVTNMQALLDDANISYKPMTSDIGIMQKLSTRTENGTVYYYTGCYNRGFNCIIKSSDLINWEYVSTPDFDNESDFENAVYVVGDTCYYFLRQTHRNDSGVLTSYNLNSRVWEAPVYVQDCQSRSDFLEYNGELYLVHAPIDRRHLSIMKINTSKLNQSYAVQTARVPFYFYPYMDKYNGELYMSFTDSYKHIQLAKFTIESISHDVIGDRLLTLVMS